jgi:hypothetical protein
LNRTRILALTGITAATLALTACGTVPAASTHTSALTVTDPDGGKCAVLQANGYCKGDTPKPEFTDPDGGVCAPSAETSGYCPGDRPVAPPSPTPPPVTVTGTTVTIMFSVSGTGEPSIQYGTNSMNDSPPGGYGPLGDGNLLPWSASIPVQSGALYYYVSAQLQGDGSITDTVSQVTVTTYSNGTSQTSTDVLATGQASGGYNIAQAESVTF